MIRGIGPVYAKRMVRLFGKDVLDIIEASPKRLREVECSASAIRRKRHTLRGDPIDRSWGRRYVHRLSPTSGLVATATNCPPNRGNSILGLLLESRNTHL